MRKPITQKHTLKPDVVYNSETVAKFINYVMWEGKKERARQIVYGALEKVGKDMKVENPLEIFEAALKNTTPTMEVRSRRVGGANYQVPREVKPSRRQAFSMKWIIEAARSKSGKPMADLLATEIIAAYNNEGDAVTKKDHLHRMADANKAFAHFAV
ncbi:MAG: 30S ribosomal protein S7 [Candidatus Paceibacterota bacterium]